MTATGAVPPARARCSCSTRFPVLQGYKNTAAVGYHLNFGDPLGFAHLGVTAAYTPDQNLPDNERGHVDVDGHYLGWRAGLSWNRSDFYDLFGPTKRSRKGYAANARLRPAPDLRRRRSGSTVSYDLAYYDKIDTLPGAQNVGDHRSTACSPARSACATRDVRRSLGAVDDEKGVTWTAVATGHRMRGLDGRRSCAAASTSACRCRSRTRRSGRAAPPASPTATATIRSRTSTSAASATTTSTTARSSATASTARMPGFDIDEISGRTFVQADGRVEPAAGGVRVARHAEPSPAIAAAGAVRLGAVDRSAATRRCARPTAASARRWTCASRVLHWYDMTLSAGYAVGYKGSRRSGNEWMISLKIM